MEVSRLSQRTHPWCRCCGRPVNWAETLNAESPLALHDQANVQRRNQMRYAGRHATQT